MPADSSFGLSFTPTRIKQTTMEKGFMYQSLDHSIELHSIHFCISVLVSYNPSYVNVYFNYVRFKQSVKTICAILQLL